MGYTHYWTQKSNLTKDEWAETLAGMHFLFEYAHENGIKLADGMGEGGVPMATADMIDFNGLGDESHETMRITRKRDEENWNFCKTARKPYDIIVTALLAYLDSIHGKKFIVTSDGRTDGWSIGTERGIKGVELARKAWPTKANQIQVPRDVRDTDRYDRYHDSSKVYQVATDHSGQLWIERIKDRARIRLDQAWYDEVMKNLPYDHRKYGRFSGNESERCAKKRLDRIWINRHINDCPVEMPDTFAPLAA